MHPIEAHFQTALFISGDQKLTHDAANLLQYVRGLVSIAHHIVNFSQRSGGGEPTAGLERVAVHGFLTGSLDLLWLMRERLGTHLCNRVRVSPGISHYKVREADNGPTEELYRSLKHYRAHGADRLVIVDEVIGGGQMGAALKRVKKWTKANGDFKHGVLALGVTTLDGQDLKDKESKMASKHSWASVQLVHVPELLACDEGGIPIKPAIQAGTSYVPYRFWGGSYEVVCKNTFAAGDCSFRLQAAQHTGAAYTSTIRQICTDNPVRPKVCWPEKSCSDCHDVIQAIRKDYGSLPASAQTGTVVGHVGKRPAPRVVLAGRQG